MFEIFEWNITNILGIVAIIVEGVALSFVALYFYKKDKSHFPCNEKTDDTKYPPKNKERQPESPHRPIPLTVHPEANNVTGNKRDNNSQKIFHRIKSIIPHQTPNAKRTKEKDGTSPASCLLCVIPAKAGIQNPIVIARNPDEVQDDEAISKNIVILKESR